MDWVVLQILVDYKGTADCDGPISSIDNMFAWKVVQI